jgi:hypothetical protein
MVRTDRVRSRDRDDVMCGERGLRRVTEAKHGEPVVARDESDGEDAAGGRIRALMSGVSKASGGSGSLMR